MNWLGLIATQPSLAEIAGSQRTIGDTLVVMTKLSSAIVSHRGRILLFLRDHRPLRDPNRWSLIGGHVDEDETFDEALVREVGEEIGIRPRNYRLLLRLAGYWGEDIALYHLPLIDTEASRIRLGDEGQKVEFFVIDEIDDLPLTANLNMLFHRRRDLFIEAIDIRNSRL